MEPKLIRHGGCGTWIDQLGEADLIGGWAEVVLDEDFAARIDRTNYQVFVTAYDPVQLFVHNRTERGFEIHVLSGSKGRRMSTMRCGYRIVGCRSD